MTAQNSAVKSRLFFKFPAYYLTKLRYLRSNLIMNSILSLLSYPTIGIMLVIICNMQRNYISLRDANADMDILGAASSRLTSMGSILLMTGIISILCLIALFVFTYVTTLRSFHYLYDKNSVDMDYSLPVDHNTRFFGDLAAVFTTTILPHLLAIIIGLILLQCSDIEALTEMSGSAIFTGIRQIVFVGLFSCIMQIGLTLLIISFCGRKAESAIYPILFNFAIPIIHALIISLIQSGIYGAVTEYSMFYFGGLSNTFGVSEQIGTMYSLSSTSPLGMIAITVLSWFTTWDGYHGEISSTAPIFTPQYFIPALLITLACFAAAYFLMKHRRNERVGMPYVFKGSNLFIPGIVIFAVTLPICSRIFSLIRNGTPAGYSYSESPLGWVIGLVVSTFIIYIVMELISGRNFRKFLGSLAKWAGTLAVSVGIAAVFAFSNGFGQSYYVPAESDISNASLFMNQYPYTGLRQAVIPRISNQNSANIITEIHKLIPKDGSGEGNGDNGGFISISYTLKNGEYIERVYDVSEELYDQCLRLTSDPDIWYTSQYSDRFSDKMQLKHIEVNNETYIPDGLTISDILEAIKKDSKYATYETLHTLQPGVREYNITVCVLNTEDMDVRNCYIDIYSWMENTVSLLQSYGIEFRDTALDEAQSAFITDCGDNYPSAVSGAFMMAISEEGFGEQSEEYITELSEKWGYWPEETISDLSRFGRLDPSDPDLIQLATVSYNEAPPKGSTRYCIVLEDNLYSSDITAPDSKVLYIPNDYNILAEKLLSEHLVYEP